MEVHPTQTNRQTKSTGQLVRRNCKIRYHFSHKTPRRARDAGKGKRVFCAHKRAQISQRQRHKGQIKAVSRAISTHLSRTSQSSTETTANKCSSTPAKWHRKQAVRLLATTAATWELGLEIRLSDRLRPESDYSSPVRSLTTASPT